MILQKGNPGKSVNFAYKGANYLRLPIQTKTIGASDSIATVTEEYLRNEIQDGDILAIAESVISVMQERAFKFSEIKYGFFAKLLSRFVHRTPAGIGLGTPETMQLAINEVGLLRVLCAAAAAAITKPLGVKGMFYRIAGERARGIDGPTDNTLPPYNEYASLLPKNPKKVIKDFKQALGSKDCTVVIVDANDIGVNLIGKYSTETKTFIKAIFKDNPLGQGSESTPFLLIRKDSNLV